MSCRFPFTDCPGCDRCAVPTIALTSPNAIPQWKMALWIGTILMLGTVAMVAVAWPDIAQRVHTAEAPV